MATFANILKQLREHYGRPARPRITDPLEMILHQTVAYLRDDEHRDAAFAALREQVGTRPKQILAASNAELVKICRIGGIISDIRGPRLRRIAQLAERNFGGDLRSVVKKPFKDAKRNLMKFPAIGEPGAEKILLFSGKHPVLALDSNGLRVLQRLGFAPESKNYSDAYRAAQKALEGQLPRTCDELIEAHQLLREHGKTLCKRTKPLCDRCPLAPDCRYFQSKK